MAIVMQPFAGVIDGSGLLCLSSGRQFFSFGGAFDMSWLPWTGPATVAEARPGH